MDLYIANSDFETVGLIDGYTSAIWTKRYYECGDFEISLPASSKMLSLIVPDSFIYRPDDERVMVVEGVQLDYDSEDGYTMIVSGRSAESLLARRVVWGQSTFYEKAQTVIKSLMSDNIISPESSKRCLSMIKLGTLGGYDKMIGRQYSGDVLLTAISEICSTYGDGFRLVRNGMLTKSGYFTFETYQGIDRSCGQSENPRAIFSKDFGNLPACSYTYNAADYATTALVLGEGEGCEQKKVGVATDVAGLSRREICVDASSVSSKSTTGTLSDDEYTSLLYGKGVEQLKEYKPEIAMEGETAVSELLEYKKDWDLGDIVTVRNQYGIKLDARITEVIESEDQNGKTVIPTFSYEDPYIAENSESYPYEKSTWTQALTSSEIDEICQ